MKALTAMILTMISFNVVASNYGMTPTYETKKSNEKLYNTETKQYNYERDDEEEN